MWAGDEPIFVERGDIQGGERFATADWGLRGHAAFGTMVATADATAAIRQWSCSARCGMATTTLATVHGPLTVVRALGPDGTAVRAALEGARHRIRDAWGRPRIDPGVWRS